MREPGNTLNAASVITLAVCFDAATNLPVFALTSTGLGVDDGAVCNVNGVYVDIQGYLDDFSYSTSRPATGGLCRRDASGTIKFTGPYVNGPWTAKVYGVGANTDSFYFGVWMIDRAKILESVYNGAFIGLYKLDSGTSWSEDSGVTKVNFIDYLASLTQRYNTNDDAAELALKDSAWRGLIGLPLYIGGFNKVRAHGRSVPTNSYAPNVINDVIKGVVQSNYSGSGTLSLGADPLLAANVGATVKMRLSSGEIVSGTIVLISGAVYGVNTITRHTNWSTVTVKHVGWVSAGNYITTSSNIGQITIDEAVSELPTSDMYIKVPSVNWYDNPPGSPQVSESNRFVHLSGYTGNKTYNIVSPPKTGKNATGVAIQYAATSGGSGFTGDKAYLNYAKSTAAASCNTYFMSYDIQHTDTVDPTVNDDYADGYRIGSLWYNSSTAKYFRCVVPSTGAAVWADLTIIPAGTTWEIIVTDTVNNALTGVNDWSFYIKQKFSALVYDSDGTARIFYSTDRGPVRVPTTHIDSITVDTTAYGIENLIRIKLKQNPYAMLNASDVPDANAVHPDNAYLLADLQPGRPAAWIIRKLLLPFVPDGLLGVTLDDDDAGNGDPASIAIRTETVYECVDLLLFEQGATLIYTQEAKIEYISTIMLGWEFVVWNDDTDTFARMEPAGLYGTVAFSDIVENSFTMTLGKLDTKIDNGLEYVGMHMTIGYSLTEDGAGDTHRMVSFKSPKSTDRTVSYTFKTLNNGASVVHGAAKLGRIGHPANYGEVARVYMFQLPRTPGIVYEAGDIILLQGFDHVNTALSSPYYTVNVGAGALPAYKYSDRSYALLPGMCVIESVAHTEYGTVAITAKQVQPVLDTNLIDVREAGDGNPPLPTAAELDALPEAPIDEDHPTTGIVLGDRGCWASSVTGDISSQAAITTSGAATDSCCNTDNIASRVNDDLSGYYSVDPANNCSTSDIFWSMSCTLMSPDNEHESSEYIEFKISLTNTDSSSRVFEIGDGKVTRDGVTPLVFNSGQLVFSLFTGLVSVGPSATVVLGSVYVFAPVFDHAALAGYLTSELKLHIPIKIVSSEVTKYCLDATGATIAYTAVCGQSLLSEVFGFRWVDNDISTVLLPAVNVTE